MSWCPAEARAIYGTICNAKANMLGKYASSSHTTTRGRRQISRAQQRDPERRLSLALTTFRERQLWAALVKLHQSREDLSQATQPARLHLQQLYLSRNPDLEAITHLIIRRNHVHQQTTLRRTSREGGITTNIMTLPIAGLHRTVLKECRRLSIPPKDLEGHHSTTRIMLMPMVEISQTSVEGMTTFTRVN